MYVFRAAHVRKTDLVVDLGDVFAEGVEGRNDHLVLQGLGDEHDVLAQHGLKRADVNAQVFDGVERVWLQVVQFVNDVAQARIRPRNAGLLHLLGANRAAWAGVVQNYVIS